jgi:hypothetical protein
MKSKREELLKLLEFVWSFVVPANPNPTTKLENNKNNKNKLIKNN